MAKFHEQHKVVLKAMKKELPKSVTFLSLYHSRSHGYCVKAVVKGKDYLFTLLPDKHMTKEDIIRLRDLILGKNE